MNRIDSSSVMVAKEEDNELNAFKNQWPSRNEEMKELLRNKETKEMKRLRIELAEDKRRIAQLEEQNDDLLLELASLKMEMSASSVKSGFDGGGSDSSLCVVAANDSFSNKINSNNDDRKRGEQKKEVISDGDGGNNNNCNETIPRRNSVAITFQRCSPHGSRRATIGGTTPNAAKSCLSSSTAHSTLRHCSSSGAHITSRRCSRRVTIGGASPYSANDLSSSISSSSAHSIPRRRISSSSKDLLRIYNGFISLDDMTTDDLTSSGGVRNSRK